MAVPALQFRSILQRSLQATANYSIKMRANAAQQAVGTSYHVHLDAGALPIWIRAAINIQLFQRRNLYAVPGIIIEYADVCGGKTRAD